MIHNCFYFYKPFVDTQLSQISQVVSWHTIALIRKLFVCKQTAFNFSQIVWWYKILFVFTSCWIDSSKFVFYQVSLYAVRCQFYAKPTAGNRK